MKVAQALKIAKDLADGNPRFPVPAWLEEEAREAVTILRNNTRFSPNYAIIADQIERRIQA